MKLTGRPLVDVALRLKGAVPNVWFAGAANVIVCAAWETVKLRVTEGAAEYIESPA
jgi:hypothetical protein